MLKAKPLCAAGCLRLNAEHKTPYLNVELSEFIRAISSSGRRLQLLAFGLQPFYSKFPVEHPYKTDAVLASLTRSDDIFLFEPCLIIFMFFL
jgi:hypothetical protein